MQSRQYILIFDSGIGGLSIYKEISKILPNYNYLYVLDNIFFPYSEKSEEFIVHNTLKIIKSVMSDYSLFLIVIACNTVSTIVLSLLRSLIDIPVVGVVPAIKPAVLLTRNGTIGLIATKNTVSSLYVRRLIDRFAKKCKVVLLGSTELVHIAQDKMCGFDISLDRIVFILKSFTDLVISPDVIVLGCTHYPFLLSEFIKIFGCEVKFIDSGIGVANRVYFLLKDNTNVRFSLVPLNKVLYLKIDGFLENMFPLFQRYGFVELEQLYL